VVAASEQIERPGSEQYHDNHMGAIFKEGFSFSGFERDLLVMNLGERSYLDISGVSGVDSISDGRGSVFADLDNDGDLDIFLVTAQRDAHYLFRNNVGQRSGWLRVEVEGTTLGRDAFGTVVRVKSSAGIQTKIKSGGAGFLSHHDGRLLFGLGSDEDAEWVEVVWPDGALQRFENVPARTSLRVIEGREGYVELVEKRFRLVDPCEPLPDLSLRAKTGEAVRLDELLTSGRRALINIWATWCVPCAEEMPELQRLYPGLSRAGVDLIGVSVDMETVEQVAGYTEALGVTYPIYTTDASTLEALYPTGEAIVPLTILLDEDGRILEILSGWSEGTARKLHALASGGAG
jgi:peroxiredoxin